VLSEFFEPRGVAVVGASREEGKVGHDVLRNLIQYGYPGRIYPVNPKADHILGLPCFPSVRDIPGELDLAVLVIPAKFCLEAARDCAAKKVPALIIITAGFKETGREGADLERKIVELAHANGMRIIGPNCLGLINTPAKLNASFAAGMPATGDIAFMSQSGAFGTAVLDWAIGERIGFSKFISVGNKADVDETTLLEAVGADRDTRVLLGYIESVQHGEEFMRAAREITRRKPVILFKSGMSAAGAKAASSHTGALAGSDNAYAAAFRQSGILRAREVVDLFDWGLAFSYQRGIGGPNVALVTNAGGPGIIATDAVERSRLQMAALAKETVDALHKALPPAANFYNPIDVLGDARAERYETAVRAALSDPNVHGVIVILTPQTSTEPLPTSQVVAKAAAEYGKPVVACYMGGPRVVEGFRYLMEHRVPVYPFPERAVAAMDALYRHRLWMDTPPGEVSAFPVAKDKVAAIFQQSRAAHRLELGEQEAREVIGAYGFKMPRSVLATTHEEAVAAAREIGLPVVMKISSPDILHKSDVGGVRVGVATELEVVGAFTAIIESARRKLPEADLSGVLVQEMIRGGRETILGMTRDAQFGPMIMFGLGGIYVEVLKDVSFRIAPLTRRDAEEMVGEIRSVRLLRGVRGQPPADFEALVEGLLRLSQLVTDFPEIVEMDLNPLAVFPKGGGTVAMDARLALKG
jgi:acetyl coenzyme A synthetase (ADP forming)-like protein